MVHPCIEDKLRFVASISIIDMFAYHPFSMSSNISSQDVTLGFHTPSGVLMGESANPHK
jgi:hypothetical protein